MRTFLRHPRQCGLASLLVAVTIVSAACGTNTAMAPVSKAGKATWLARHQAMNARAQQGHVGLIYVAEVCRLAASHVAHDAGTFLSLALEGAFGGKKRQR